MTLPPPHPQRQAKAPGKRRPAPHLRHDQTMKRPGEPLHVATHSLQPHHEQPETKEKP